VAPQSLGKLGTAFECNIPSALVDLCKPDPRASAMRRASRQLYAKRARLVLLRLHTMSRCCPARPPISVSSGSESLHAERHLVLMNAARLLVSRITNFFKRRLVDCIHSVDQRAPRFSTHALWIAKIIALAPLVKRNATPGIFVLDFVCHGRGPAMRDYPIRDLKLADHGPRWFHRRRAASERSAPCGALRIGSASSTTSSTDGANRPLEQGQRARTASISAWLAAAGAGAPGDRLGEHRRPSGPGRAARTSARIASTTEFADRQTPHEALRRHQVFGRHGRLRLGLFRARRGRTGSFAPPRDRGKSTSICIRKAGRAGPPEGDMCLPAPAGSASRAHGNGRGKSLTRPGNGDVLFLHRLQQCGLRCGGLARLISSAISSWANTGPERKRKLRLPPCPSSSTSEPRMSDGIRFRRETGCAAPSRPSTVPMVSTSLVLARPGTPTSSALAAGQDGHQGMLDDPLLPEDDGADTGSRGPDMGRPFVSAARTIMSSNFSSPSLVTAMTPVPLLLSRPPAAIRSQLVVQFRSSRVDLAAKYARTPGPGHWSAFGHANSRAICRGAKSPADSSQCPAAYAIFTIVVIPNCAITIRASGGQEQATGPP